MGVLTLAIALLADAANAAAPAKPRAVPPAKPPAKPVATYPFSLDTLLEDAKRRRATPCLPRWIN